MKLRGYVCRTLERQVFVLVSFAAAEVVGEMALAVTPVDTIFLEANALAISERHGRKKEGWVRSMLSKPSAAIIALRRQHVTYFNR